MTPARYVVIVTGSRKWVDRGTIYNRLAQYPRGTIVLHGAADGADTIAHEASAHISVPHPYFGHLGRRGGHARNALLVALGVAYKLAGYCVIVEAFPMVGSRGTWNCVQQAEDAGLVVRVERKWLPA